MISQLKDNFIFENELSISVYQYSTYLLEKIINQNKIKKINLLFQFEYDIPLDEKIVEIINLKNIKCNVVTCANDINFIKKRLNELGFKNSLISIETFPTYFFNNIYRKLEKNYLQIWPDKEFEHTFLSYNGHTKPHRTEFIDCLYRLNLLDKGIVSYLQLGGLETNWKYYNGKIMEHDVELKSTDGNNLNNCIINEAFLKSFLHIVTETCTETTVFSEKTTKPLFLGLPFLVLGSQFFHRDLENLGFKLYTEIFDYSFDECNNLEDRITGLIKNIMFCIKNKNNLNYYYKKIYPKILHNQTLAIKFATSWKYYPEIFKNHIEKISNAKYAHDNDFQELIYINEYIKDYVLPDLTNFTVYSTKNIEEIYF